MALAGDFLAAIKDKRRVILTTGGTPENSFSRAGGGYVGIFCVDDVEFDDNGLRFTVVNRECSLK